MLLLRILTHEMLLVFYAKIFSFCLLILSMYLNLLTCATFTPFNSFDFIILNRESMTNLNKIVSLSFYLFPVYPYTYVAKAQTQLCLYLMNGKIFSHTNCKFSPLSGVIVFLYFDVIFFFNSEWIYWRYFYSMLSCVLCEINLFALDVSRKWKIRLVLRNGMRVIVRQSMIVQSLNFII